MMSFLIFLGVVGGCFFITVSLISLLAVFFTLDDKDFVRTAEAFIIFGLSALFGTLILSQTKEAMNSQPPIRDIHLTVPADSSVNAQVTSGSNTVNITDL